MSPEEWAFKINELLNEGQSYGYSLTYDKYCEKSSNGLIVHWGDEYTDLVIDL